MNAQNKTIDSGWLGRWVAANALGLGLGMALFALVAEGLEQSNVIGAAGEIVGHIIGLALAGGLFGFLQWRALPQSSTWAGWSVLAGGVGLCLGYAVGYELLGFPFDYVLGPALSATLIAGALSRGLRQHSVRAGWWGAASALGFMLGSLPGLAISFLGLGEAIGTTFVGWAVLNGLMCAITGAIGGAVGGSVIQRMLRPVALASRAESLTSSPR
jgi:hypothetical protein